MLHYFLLFSLLLPALSFAKSAQEISQLAIDYSSLVSASELSRRATEYEAKVKKIWQNPQFMSQVGGLKTGTMSGATVEVTLTQPIPLNQKYSLRGDLAQTLLELDELDVKNKKNWVTHQALLSAWKVKVFSALNKHISERKERMRLAKLYVSKRPQVTARQMVEAQIINNQIRLLENSLLMNLVEIETAQAELEYWTGVKISPEEIDLDFPKQSELITTIAPQNGEDLETRMAQKNLEAAKIESKISKKEKLPDLIVGAGYRLEDMSPANHFSYGVLGITIPIWDTGENRVQAANARIRRDEKLLEEKQKAVHLKVSNHQNMIHYFNRLFSSFFFEDIHNQEKTLQVAENGFKQGVVDINTFLQTEVQTHDIIDQIYLNWMKYLETISQYNLTVGEELKWTR
jgi:hypothetical protein